MKKKLSFGTCHFNIIYRNTGEYLVLSQSKAYHTLSLVRAQRGAVQKTLTCLADMFQVFLVSKTYTFIHKNKHLHFFSYVR